MKNNRSTNKINRRRSRRSRSRPGGFDKPSVRGTAKERRGTRTGVTQYTPDSVRVVLKYEDYREYSPLAAAGAYVFSGNSAYDPDVTNVGRQPTGFDEYSAIYTRYRVYGSTFKVSFVNLVEKHAINAVILPTRSNSALADYGTYAALPYAKTGIIGIEAGMSRTSLRSNMSTTKINGISDIFADLSYAAFTSGSPAERWYWQYFLEVSDHVTLALVAVIVSIEYDVEFFARADTGVSFFDSLLLQKCMRFSHLSAADVKRSRLKTDEADRELLACVDKMLASLPPKRKAGVLSGLLDY